MLPQEKTDLLIFYTARAPISSAADVLCPSRALMYRTAREAVCFPGVQKGLDFTVQIWRGSIYSVYIYSEYIYI